MKAHVALVAVALAFSAVSAPACVSKPVVALDHAEIRSASPGGVGLLVLLRVNNGNSFDVQVRNVHGQASVGSGWLLAPLDYQPNIWLPAGQTTVVPVPVVIPWDIVPALIAQTVGSSAIAYRFRGTVDVTAVRMLGIQRNDYPVDDGGTISRQVLMDTAARVMPIRVGF